MWLLLACVAPPPSVVDADTTRVDTARVDTARTDTGPSDDSGTADTDTSPYVGDLLDPPLAPPVFAVLDQDGAWRTEADLVGHPTVLWFFREAEGAT